MSSLVNVTVILPFVPRMHTLNQSLLMLTSQNMFHFESNNADNCDSNSCKDGKCIEGADNGEFCDTLGLGVGCKPGLDCISGISLSPQCTDRQLGSPCVAYRNCDSGSCYQQQCVPLGQDGDACGGSRRCVDGTECLIIPVLKCSAGDRGKMRPCL